jgi:large subunit ribosomal protein L32
VAVPKRRTSRSKRDMRRANHDKVTVPNLIACPNCKEPCVPHRVCPACGFYKGVKVKAVKTEGSSS